MCKFTRIYVLIYTEYELEMKKKIFCVIVSIYKFPVNRDNIMMEHS